MRSTTVLNDITTALAGLVEQFEQRAKTVVPPKEWPAWQLFIHLADEIPVEQSEWALEARQASMRAVLNNAQPASQLDSPGVLELLYQLARNERWASSGDPNGGGFLWPFLSSNASSDCLDALISARDDERASTDPADLKAKLEASALFHASLSSRELFHTNFLAWMIKKYPRCLPNIFQLRSGVLKVDKVMREKNNLDLQVRYDAQDGTTGLFVVENKLKDAPRRDQLERYGEDLKRRNPNTQVEMLLLSLVSPAEAVTTLPEWRYMDYGALGLQIQRWARVANLPEEDRTVIDLYGRMLSDLSVLFGVAFSDGGLSKTDWLQKSQVARQKRITASLKELRLSDMVGKFQASMVLDEVSKKIPQALREDKCFMLKLGSGLTNTHPMIDTVLERPTAKGILRLGVQVQENQYRRFIDFDGFDVPRQTSSKAKIERLRAWIENTDNFRWLFAPTVDEGGTITPIYRQPDGTFSKGMPTRMRAAAPIKSYAPHFIYQYVDLL